MKFVLILTLFGIDAPDYGYVVDYNMTGIDCVETLEKHQRFLEQTFHPTDFALYCEMDDAYED